MKLEIDEVSHYLIYMMAVSSFGHWMAILYSISCGSDSLAGNLLDGCLWWQPENTEAVKVGYVFLTH